MNQLTQLYSYLKQLADADPLVNDVTRMDAMDFDKEVITPIVAIQISSGGFTNGATIKYDVELSALSQRDINKEIIVDKFWGNDNEVDNKNTCTAILNRMWSKMYVDFEDNNITASENPRFEIGTLEGVKLLDGVKISFEVEMPNTTISLCQ
jgi:hypothetical protein